MKYSRFKFNLDCCICVFIKNSFFLKFGWFFVYKVYILYVCKFFYFEKLWFLYLKRIRSILNEYGKIMCVIIFYCLNIKF